VGKRIVFGFGERNDGLFVVIHLMVAGRLRWETPGKPIPKVVLLVALLIVGSDDLLDDAGLVAVAIVGASRVLAYVREKSAHELAKAIPLALLFLLMTGASVDIDQRMAAAAERGGADITAEMLEFLVALEILLRLATDTSRVAIRAWQRRGLSDMVDEGSPPA
jgi:hypothetical protein